SRARGTGLGRPGKRDPVVLGAALDPPGDRHLRLGEINRHDVSPRLEQQELLIGDSGKVAAPFGLESRYELVARQIHQPERIRRGWIDQKPTPEGTHPQRAGRSGKGNLPDLL